METSAYAYAYTLPLKALQLNVYVFDLPLDFPLVAHLTTYS